MVIVITPAEGEDTAEEDKGLGEPPGEDVQALRTSRAARAAIALRPAARVQLRPIVNGPLLLGGAHLWSELRGAGMPRHGTDGSAPRPSRPSPVRTNQLSQTFPLSWLPGTVEAMPLRLGPLDVSMLALDTARTPGQVGTVDIFEAGNDGFDYERLIALIRQRIDFVPRHRQRVRSVPGSLASPVWVDDENFDLTFHVRQSALPRPGSLNQLRDFAGRVLARRLDRSRPLWEMYLVEGLLGNRFALVAKSHLCLVDGIDSVDIGQVLLDADPDSATSLPERAPESTWRPLPEPSSLELLVGAVWDNAREPAVA